MCGIVGFLDYERRFDRRTMAVLVTAMADSIAHRGPDDAAIHVEEMGDLAFGFRRLAIVDLSAAGRQPMVSASGRTLIVFNGEIYNAEEMRRDLDGCIARFRGHSDTEVLVEWIEAFGLEKTLQRTVGMFALAVFDTESRRLCFARDRFGKKPLYIACHHGAVLFASELRALLTHPLFIREIDQSAVAAFLQMGWVPHPRSIYRNVRQLEPGAMAEIDKKGEIRRHFYWSATDEAASAMADPVEGSDEELLDRCEAVVSQAVSCRMIADVPLGAFLSGGIDSSLIVSLMQRQSSQPVKTFSIGFAEAGFDEAPFARAVATHLKTEHHELYVTPDDALAVVPRLADLWDEPFADSSQIPTYLVSRLARGKVTVALSGDGGDEVFAGYERYGMLAHIAAAERLMLGALGPLARSASGLFDAPALSGLRTMMPPVRRAQTSRWLARLALLAGEDGLERSYRGLLGLGFASPPVVDGDQVPFEPAGLAARFHAPAALAQIVDTSSYLPDDILVKVDRASMAVGLEARAPLLDQRVFELAWRLPERLKRRGRESKWALRHLLYRYVPRPMVDRPKKGFNVPVAAWLRGPLREWAEDLVSEKALREAGLVEPAPIRALWQRHLAGENWHNPLWCVLSLHAWHRRWMMAPQAPPPAMLHSRDWLNAIPAFLGQG